MQVIPSIDIYEGKCVRLTEGAFASRVDYSVRPHEAAQKFADAGATMLHVVDLEGAKTGRLVNLESIQAICGLALEVQVGGGIRTSSDIKALLSIGAKRAVVGSMAAREPQTFAAWVRDLGADRFCVAIDFKDGTLAVDGWQASSALTPASVIESALTLGVRYFLSTDIRRDGKLQGPNLELYRLLASRYPAARWIASGGVGSAKDLADLRETGVFATVVGKAFFEGKLSYEDCWRSTC